MALELLSLLCTFENSTNVAKYHSIEILFRIAKRSIVHFHCLRTNICVLANIGEVLTPHRLQVSTTERNFKLKVICHFILRAQSKIEKVSSSANNTTKERKR